MWLIFNIRAALGLCLGIWPIAGEVAQCATPTFTPPSGVVVECGLSTLPARTGWPSNSGNACATLITTNYTDQFTADGCGSAGTLTRSWQLWDTCGNTNTQVQTITIVDTTAPVFTVPPNATIDCTESSFPNTTGWPTVTPGDCSGAATHYRDRFTVRCGAAGSITRTWYVADTCGNTNIQVQVITIVDNTAPTFLVPPNVSVDCAAPITPHNTGWPSITSGDCSGASINYSDSFQASNGIDVYILFGQSNAAGRSFANELTDQSLAAPYANGIHFAYKEMNRKTLAVDGYTPLGPLRPHTYLSTPNMVGPEITLGRKLAQSSVNDVALLSFVSGGTTIENFLPDRNKLYPHMVQFLHEQRTKLLQMGYTDVHWRGLFVSQGESDSLARTDQLRLVNRLKAIRSSLVQSLETDSLSLVYSHMRGNWIDTESFNYSELNAGATYINQAVGVWANVDPCVEITTSSADLKTRFDAGFSKVDAIHLSADSYALLGNRLFDSYSRNEENIKILGGCANAGVLTRTWQVADACGNTDTQVQTITIVETAPACAASTAPNLKLVVDAKHPTGHEVRWTSSARQLYTIETTTDLETGTWTDLPGFIGIPGVSGIQSIIDPQPKVQLRHYRIKVRVP